MKKFKVTFEESYDIEDYSVPTDPIRLKIWNEFVEDRMYTGNHQYPQFYNDIDEMVMKMLKEMVTEHLEKYPHLNIDPEGFFMKTRKVVDRNEDLIDIKDVFKTEGEYEYYKKMKEDLDETCDERMLEKEGY